MQPFQGKVVLVTGAGAGIGRAAAVQFANCGARVVATGRRSAPLATLAEQHPNINFVVADAAITADATRTITTIIERWGRLSALAAAVTSPRMACRL